MLTSRMAQASGLACGQAHPQKRGGTKQRPNVVPKTRAYVREPIMDAPYARRR